MHYGDQKQLEKNQLIIVVYKHGTIRKNVFEYRFSSIQKCSYFPIKLLVKLIENPKKYLKDQLKDQKEEEWYEITINSPDGYKHMDVKSIKNVSKTKNEFHRLH